MGTKQVVIVGLAAVIAAAGTKAGPPAGGTVSGKVTYAGTPPKMEPIDMSREPSCAKMYTAPTTAETVITGGENSLANVVVYISSGAPDEATPATAVVFNQKGCRYIPHVLAFQVNQELKIQNEDQTSHNIHPQSQIDREWNKSQPPGAPPISERYDKAEVQRTPVDARKLRGAKELAFCRERRGIVLSAESAAGKIHSDGVARIVWRAVTRSDHQWQRNENSEFRF